MKRCPECQRAYEESKNFCYLDGTGLKPDVPIAPCKTCGYELTRYDRFCEHCGEKTPRV